MQQYLLDIINNKNLHIKVIGSVPDKYCNDATHSTKCFIGGSYAMEVASNVLDIGNYYHNDIDVYIADKADAISGDQYQNILLQDRKISISTAAFIIHMYDLECCKFFIYSGYVFAAKSGIEALEKRAFTVNSRFMGCPDTIERVKKYKERGFNITTEVPEKFYDITYYETHSNLNKNTILFPRNINKILEELFDIKNGKAFKRDMGRGLNEIKKHADCLYGGYDKDLYSLPLTLLPHMLHKHHEHFIEDISTVKWNRIYGLPTIDKEYRLFDVVVDDDIIMLEFGTRIYRIVYVINRNTGKGTYKIYVGNYYSSDSLVYWHHCLARLGISFDNNGVYLA